MDDAGSNKQRQATRVFKKSSPNGKITVYLGKRDVMDHITHVDPIDGVVLIDPEYVKDQKVFEHVLAAFPYGQEDLDVLGLNFKKDYLAAEQIYPSKGTNKRSLTRLQERLVRRLGPSAHPFYLKLPPHCPASVTLQPAPADTCKPCGVDYELKAFVADSQDDKPHKRSVGSKRGQVCTWSDWRLNCSTNWRLQNQDPTQRENIGIIVQYKVKVKLCLGPLGGEENGQDNDDDIIFKDFARLRLKEA